MQFNRLTRRQLLTGAAALTAYHALRRPRFAHAAFAVVGHVAGQSVDGTTVVTNPVDTVALGATWAVIIAVSQNGATPIDGVGSTTWTSAVQDTNSGLVVELWYTFALVTGVSQDFGLTDQFPAIYVLLFTGSPLSIPETNHNGNIGSTTVQPGAVTAVSGEITVCGACVANGGATPTINSPFTAGDANGLSGGLAYGGGSATSGSTGSLNPTWSAAGASNMGAVIARFSESAPPASGTQRGRGKIL